ncbi:hypothetical protein QJS10_CPA02g00901 [Acorus calamus]|uniref:Reverse transcriptase zinc-binding domain-containing protein n=1 Tax=Acorus calamus TaxID=4465 RepID=A0AAV9FBT7_ACOCL|nr:hypothetical protein QJS10_CPA02g00901 [Acorus calamus]
MWCRIVEARYRVGGDLANRFPRVSPRVSRIWRDILIATAQVSQGPNCIWSINLSRELSWEEEVEFPDMLLELSLVEFNDPLPDKALWSPQPRMGFSVRSCYKWVRRDHPPLQATAMKWRKIWGPKIPLKVKAFVWLMFQERILTKTYRAKWSL